MTEHTPVPWKIGEWPDKKATDTPYIFHPTSTEYKNTGIVICELGANTKEGYANANFIVAACNVHADLLAACEAARDVIASITEILIEHEFYKEAADFEPIEKQLEATIKKARPDDE